MAKLKYNSDIRLETDPDIISNLLRKGWILFPNEIEYNKSTEKLLYDDINNVYFVIPLSDEELQNIADRERERISLENINKKIADFQLAISQGYTVLPENFILSLDDNSRNLFTQMLVLLQQAMQLNIINGDNIQSITDTNNIAHTLTVNRFIEIMISYGFFYKNLWDEYNI